MEKIAQEILKNLDGFTCRVNSGGMYVNGSIEGECRLSYVEYYGLVMSVPLKWNDVKPQEQILPILNNHLPMIIKGEINTLQPITFDARDEINKEISDMISNLWVRVGLISFRGIKSIRCSGSASGELYSVIMEFEKSTIELTCFDPKNKQLFAVASNN